jgi:hypothetical protein
VVVARRLVIALVDRITVRRRGMPLSPLISTTGIIRRGAVSVGEGVTNRAGWPSSVASSTNAISPL